MQLSEEPVDFKCLCADCPECGEEVVESLAYSHRKNGVDSPDIVELQGRECQHRWRLPLNELVLRVKTRAEIDALGGPGVFAYR